MRKLRKNAYLNLNPCPKKYTLISKTGKSRKNELKIKLKPPRDFKEK